MIFRSLTYKEILDFNWGVYPLNITKDSTNYHRGKYKHWAKLVTGVDTTKTNGYAFEGEFLNINAEHKIPVGSIIAEVCGAKIKIYELKPNGKALILEGYTSSMSSIIDSLANKYFI